MSRPALVSKDYAPWAGTVRACEREFVRVARSFWLIPELIPEVARQDISLLYCFCRELDDAVDEAPSADEARVALQRFRDELQGTAQQRPLIAAFLAGVPRNGLPLECVGHLLDGVESDLGLVRMPDDDALLRYAYRVSSAVGLMLARLLGVCGAEAERRVVDLGLALQLSNVLVGVAGDALRGRVYLPQTRLAAAQLRPEDVLREPLSPALRPVLRGLAQLADRYYQSAEQGAALVPLRYRHGVILLGRAYGGLGWEAALGAPALAAPGQLPFLVKALRLAELFVLALRPVTLGLVPIPPHDPALHRALAGLHGADAPTLPPDPLLVPNRRDAVSPNPEPDRGIRT